MLKEPLYRNIVPVPLYACGDGSLTIGSSTCHPASRSRAARANFTGICGNMSRKICGLSAVQMKLSTAAAWRVRAHSARPFAAQPICRAAISAAACVPPGQGGRVAAAAYHRVAVGQAWRHCGSMIMFLFCCVTSKGPSWEVNTLAAKQSMTKRPYNEQHAMPHHALSGCGHGGGTQTADQACSQA